MLLVAFALSSVMFVACNKYDDDIERIDGELAALNATVQTLKAAVDGGAVISSVSNTAEGVKFTLSNGQSYVVNHGTVGKDGANGADGKDGQDGKPGSVVTIGENGNWHIDGVDQGVSAVGASTFVVDCGSYYELNVLEKVDGENAEIVKINLPKTKAITELKVVTIGTGNQLVYGGADVVLNYGPKLGAKIEFNGNTYAKNSYLVAAGSKFTAIVNPIDADATLYDFYLEDSKGNAPFAIGEAVPNKTDGALTKGTPTVNNGVYDMPIIFAEGFNFADNKIPAENVAYALTTITANGKVASDYEVKVKSNKASSATGTITPVTSYSDVDQETLGSIDLTEAFTAGEDLVVDYYFELVNPTVDGAKGVVLNGYTLTAPANTTVSLVLHYLPVYANGTEVKAQKANVTATFAYVPGSATLDNVSWTIQNDGKSTTDENIVYVPLGSLQSALMGATDSNLPSLAVKYNSWTWADGTGLNKVTVTRNGKKYGKNDDSDYYVGTIPTNVFPAITGFYYIDKNGDYVPAGTTIDKPLYVAFTFDSANAFPGEFKVTLGINKASNSATITGADGEKYDYEVPVNVTVVAPATPEIVKNAPYFDGDNAVVYGTPSSTGVTVDFDNLFTTTGLSFTIAKVNFDLNGNGSLADSEKELVPWTIDSDNVVTIPLRTDNSKGAANSVLTSYYNTFNVGSTQSVTATKLVLANPYIDQMSYTFNVTAKSPVVVSYTGEAKVINDDPITIAVDEFTGKSLKTGDALYIGKIVADKTYNVDATHISSVSIAADANDANKKYITVKAPKFDDANAGVVTRKDAEGNTTSTAQAVKVERVTGIAQQSPVTCKVNVTIVDTWGVTTVVPVNVTVNPLQ